MLNFRQIFELEINSKKISTDIIPIDFPQEDKNTWVRIYKTYISVKDFHSLNLINFVEIRRIYAVNDKNNCGLHFVTDTTSLTININYSRFENFYKSLIVEFPFDQKVFIDTVIKKKHIKKLLWRSIQPKNYHILKDNNGSDINLGYEIQSPEKDFVSWDTTYADLRENKNIIFSKDENDYTKLSFRYTVRIGNTIFDNLESSFCYQRKNNTFYYDQRQDIAVQNFGIRCYNGSNSDKSYLELKNLLLSKTAKRMKSYQAENRLDSKFGADEIIFSPSYWYDSEYGYEDGYTYIAIDNQRLYSHLLENRDYESVISIDSSLLFEKEGLDTGRDDYNPYYSYSYKKDNTIKKRPEKIIEKFGVKSVIWLDKKNNKMGFASSKFCQLFDIDEVRNFSIQNVLPAKGGGYSELAFALKSGREVSIFTADQNYFDEYKNELKSTFDREVIFLPEYYNC